MAGIFDDVMDGINAKEKQDGKQTETKTDEKQEEKKEPEKKQDTKPAEGDKPMNEYSDDFKKKYGDKKKA